MIDSQSACPQGGHGSSSVVDSTGAKAGGPWCRARRPRCSGPGPPLGGAVIGNQSSTLEAMAGQDFGKLEKVLRFGEGRRLKRLAEQAAYIRTLRPEVEELSAGGLAGQNAQGQQRL